MQHPPIKRHDSLKPLSRDHYGGLVQARRLRLAADREPPERLAAVREFLEEWHTVTAEHFEDEERLLGDLIDERPHRDRLFRDHVEVRRLADEARLMLDRDEPPSPAWLRELSALLNDHIRWEERELFPLIERTADAEALHAVEQETELIEQIRPRWTAHRR